MKKGQNITFIVSNLFWILPEIVWKVYFSVAMSLFVDDSTKKYISKNFLLDANHNLILISVMLVQAFGLCFSLYLLHKSNFSKLTKILLTFVYSLILLFVGFILYSVLSLVNGIGF